MSAQAVELFRQLLKDPDNSRCFDCARPGTQWASVSHGIYICLECSGQHRGLGVHISFVKSVSMDAWSTQQLRLMTCGGNKRLKEYFHSYQYPASLGIKEKYATKAAQFYREMLKAEAESKPLQAVPPRLDEGLETIPGSEHLFRPRQGQGFGNEESNFLQKREEAMNGGWWNNTKSAFSEALTKASDATKSVLTTQTIDRVKETGVMDSVKSAASSVLDKSVIIGNSLVERSREIASDSLRNVTDRIGEFGHRAFESASSTIDKFRGKNESAYQSMDYRQEEMMTIDEMMQRDRERLRDLESPPAQQDFHPLTASRSMAQPPDLLSDFEPRP